MNRRTSAAILASVVATLVGAHAAAAPKGPAGPQQDEPVVVTEVSALRYDAKRLRSYRTDVLLAFFTAESQQRNLRSPEVHSTVPLRGVRIVRHLPDVERELLRRKAVAEVLETFETPTDCAQRYWMKRVLGKMRDERIDPRLRELADGDDERAYLATRHFADRGETWALERMRTRDYSRACTAGSLEWAELFELFGTYRYQPATFNLVDSIDSWSLDITEAAIEALEQLYPDGPRGELGSPADAQERWLEYLARFSHPGGCRIPWVAQGIELYRSRGEDVHPRNDAWRQLLDWPVTCEDGACFRHYADERQRYLLTESCVSEEGLEEGLHIFTVDAERMDFPWPTPEIRQAVCDDACPAGGDCSYSLKSNDGVVFELRRYHGGERPAYFALRIERGNIAEVVEGCTCDLPC